MTRRFFAVLAAFSLAASLVGVPVGAYADDGANAGSSSPIVIVHTNDVHCAVDQDAKNGNLGYASLVSYVKDAKSTYGNGNVALVDAGDAVQGRAMGTLTKGEYLIDIMNQAGYDIAVPGNHEFDYGMDQFNKLVGRANAEYVSCNFVDLRSGKTVFDAYAVREYGTGADKTKVAYVGICTPETLTKSSPASFKDQDGNFVYGFCQDETGEALYAAVQNAVDAARAAGADYVVAIGHLGQKGITERWRSDTVVANTQGIDTFIDGHSHEAYEQVVKNKDGKDVPLAQTGTQLVNIGVLTIDPATSAVSAAAVNAADGTELGEDAKADDAAETDVDGMRAADGDVRPAADDAHVDSADKPDSTDERHALDQGAKDLEPESTAATGESAGSASPGATEPGAASNSLAAPAPGASENEPRTNLAAPASEAGANVLETASNEQAPTATGSIEGKLVDSWSDQDPDMLKYVNELDAKIKAITDKKIGTSDYRLMALYPDKQWAVRAQETNLGDFVADAYYASAVRGGLQVDAAFVNGGGIRADVEAGDVTYGNLIDVQPYNNQLCVAEVRGQDLLDALEMGARMYPDPLGGFLQVSGISYTIRTDIPSSVVTDATSNFVRVDGPYRVQNVTVGGRPLDVGKTYRVASHTYYLEQGGDGMTMLKSDAVTLLGLDNEALIDFITNDLNGTIGAAYANPNGQGRIVVKNGPDSTGGDATGGDALAKTGDGTATASATASAVALSALACALGAARIARRGEKREQDVRG